MPIPICVSYQSLVRVYISISYTKFISSSKLIYFPDSRLINLTRLHEAKGLTLTMNCLHGIPLPSGFKFLIVQTCARLFQVPHSLSPNSKGFNSLCCPFFLSTQSLICSTVILITEFAFLFNGGGR